MSRILLIMLCCGLMLSACDSSKSENQNTENEVPLLPDQTSVDTTVIQNPTVSSPQVQPQTQTMPAPATSTSAGMNPAHGEPGHRCDIAVGAPLNSPAGDKTVPVN